MFAGLQKWYPVLEIRVHMIDDSNNEIRDGGVERAHQQVCSAQYKK